jgi:hypothetical protein
VNDTEPVRAAVETLSKALEAEDFSGWDPYDALASPVIAKVARLGLLRQVGIQTVKALPVNVRPFLGVPKQQHTKALALFVSAYSRLAAQPGGEHYRELAVDHGERLRGRAVPSGGGIGWGYDFDVQTRWGYYRRGQPNGVVTAFAAHALLDLASVTGDDGLREPVERMLAFARSELLVERADGSFFSYVAGSKTPIHNASLLVASVFARCDALDSDEGLSARSAVEYSLDCQRPDGSWPYGEGARLGWVDGYHTAYVLRTLAWCDGVAGAPPVREAIVSGLDLYLKRLIDPDGAPRSSLRFRYPLDIHAAASAIWSLSELRDYDERALPIAKRVLDWALRSMRREDGRFAFQRRRLFRNSVPYVRWSDGHMLLGLASYLRAVENG